MGLGDGFAWQDSCCQPCTTLVSCQNYWDKTHQVFRCCDWMSHIISATPLSLQVRGGCRLQFPEQTKSKGDQHSYQHQQELPGDLTYLLDLQRMSLLGNQNALSYLTKPLDLPSVPSAMGCWASATRTNPPYCFMQWLLPCDLVFLLVVFSPLFKAKWVKLKTLAYCLTSQLSCAFPITGCSLQSGNLERYMYSSCFFHSRHGFEKHIPPPIIS